MAHNSIYIDIINTIVNLQILAVRIAIVTKKL